MMTFALVALVIGGHGLLALMTALVLAVGITLATKGPIGRPEVRTYAAGAAAMGKGLAVVRGTDDNTVAIAGANVSVLGFIDESNINAGDDIGIVEGGEVLVPIGAAVAVGNWLITNASGQVVPTSAAGDNIVGQALSSNSNAGDFIVMHINQFVRGASTPTTYVTASGAIPVAPGLIGLNGAAALAETLATPTTPAQDGIPLTIVALTAHAHTVTTAANKIQDTNATYDTVTFAHVGDMVELKSINGVWQVIALRGATLSEV
jgi:hypothetical protein